MSMFKVGDTVEFVTGEKWKIVSNSGLSYTLELVNETTYTTMFGLKKGDTATWTKDYVETNATLVSTSKFNRTTTQAFTANNAIHAYPNRNTPPVAFTVVDNLHVIDLTVTTKINKCECGAHKVKDHMHSSWCPEFTSVWKNA